MAKIEGRTSMKYPQFHQIPKDGNARIRILTGCDDEHFYATSMPEKLSCPICDAQETPKPKDDAFKTAFAPFPVSTMYGYDELQAMNRARQVFQANAVEIKWQTLPTPIRKKKSWLRYSSNKKWSRQCPKRQIRRLSSIKTLTISKSFMDKLEALQKNHPLDTAFMDGLRRHHRRG